MREGRDGNAYRSAQWLYIERDMRSCLTVNPMIGSETLYIYGYTCNACLSTYMKFSSGYENLKHLDGEKQHGGSESSLLFHGTFCITF